PASRIRCSARRCCAGSRSSVSRTSKACPRSPPRPSSRGSTTAGSSSGPPASVNAVSVEPQVRHSVEDLLDEESLAVLAILLAVSLEFGFGFAKAYDWWEGLIAGPSSLGALIGLFRSRRSRQVLIRAVRWAVGQTP